MQPNNRCQRGYFDTFQSYLPVLGERQEYDIWCHLKQQHQNKLNKVVSMLLLRPYFDRRQPKHGPQCQNSTGKYNSFRLPFILFCISCTTRVSQVTLCEQFEKFMHLALGFKFDRSHFDNWQCLNEGGSGSSKGTTFLCNVSHYCVDQRLQITGYNSSPLSFRFSYIAAFLPE